MPEVRCGRSLASFGPAPAGPCLLDCPAHRPVKGKVPGADPEISVKGGGIKQKTKAPKWICH